MDNQNILQVEAKPQSRENTLGQGVQIQVQFTNISELSLRFPRKIENFDDCFLIEFTNVTSASDNLALESEEERLLPKVSFPLGEEFYITLKPGENFSREYNLAEHFQAPGLYKFRLLFQAKSGYSLFFESEGTRQGIELMEFPSNWIELELR